MWRIVARDFQTLRGGKPCEQHLEGGLEQHPQRQREQDEDFAELERDQRNRAAALEQQQHDTGQCGHDQQRHAEYRGQDDESEQRHRRHPRAVARRVAPGDRFEAVDQLFET